MSTKLVLWPVVDKVPRLSEVLYTGELYLYKIELRPIRSKGLPRTPYRNSFGPLALVKYGATYPKARSPVILEWSKKKMF